MAWSSPAAEEEGALGHDSPQDGQRDTQTKARRSREHVTPFTISMRTDAVGGGVNGCYV